MLIKRKAIEKLSVFFVIKKVVIKYAVPKISVNSKYVELIDKGLNSPFALDIKSIYKLLKVKFPFINIIGKKKYMFLSIER